MSSKPELRPENACREQDKRVLRQYIWGQRRVTLVKKGFLFYFILVAFGQRVCRIRIPSTPGRFYCVDMFSSPLFSRKLYTILPPYHDAVQYLNVYQMFVLDSKGNRCFKHFSRSTTLSRQTLINFNIFQQLLRVIIK